MRTAAQGRHACTDAQARTRYSLKYHQLHPEYLHTRIEALGQTYGLRVLVLMCDITNHEAPIRELTRVCLGANMTIMVCWDAPEAARTLALFKTFEKRPPDLIKERVDSSHMAHLTAALTAVKGINKTDVTTLTTTFGVRACLAACARHCADIGPRHRH